jgi:hypothetical protein
LQVKNVRACIAVMMMLHHFAQTVDTSHLIA